MHMDNNRSAYIAYTDGSSRGNPGPSGWAVLVDGKQYYGTLGIATNNYAEMYAIYQAMDIVPPNSTLTIMTDSRLVIGWFTRNWKLNNPKIRALKRECDTLRDSKTLKVSFQKVKGHSSDEMNNKVDKLARGCASLKTELPRRVAHPIRD